MVVTVKLGDPLWKATGQKVVRVSLDSARTVSDLFAEMGRRYPAFGEAVQRAEYDLPYTLFRNESLVDWAQIGQTPLADGDQIFVFLPVSGG
ncbi:MAG: MoaD/ThiS family protein [Chloroflexi bacterium]|nr:MoaD/ThiS family protein [Chloroflexota bacterium]